MPRYRGWKSELYQHDVGLNHPIISEEAFIRPRSSRSAFAYGELDDRDALEREMILQELQAT